MDNTGFVVVIIKPLVLQVANATVCGGAFAFLPARFPTKSLHEPLSSVRAMLSLYHYL
jgi:hypothetical protein